MKNIVLLLILLIGITSNNIAQHIPKNYEGLAEYTDLIRMDSLKKEAITEKAKEWFKTTYGNSYKVRIIENVTEIMLVGTATIEKVTYEQNNQIQNGGNFVYTISVHCKDGKYKCIINEIRYNNPKVVALKRGADLSDAYPLSSAKYEKDNYEHIWKDFQKQVDAQLRALILALRDYMHDVQE